MNSRSSSTTNLTSITQRLNRQFLPRWMQSPSKTPSKSPNKRQEHSPNQKMKYYVEIQTKADKFYANPGKFQKEKKNFIERNKVFPKRSDNQQEIEKLKSGINNRHAQMIKWKVKYEAGNADQKGKSDYNVIYNPRPEPEKKAPVKYFAQKTSLSTNETWRRLRKTPENSVTPRSNPIVNRDIIEPRRSRTPERQPSETLQRMNARKHFLPADCDERYSRTPSPARLRNNRSAIDFEEPKLTRRRVIPENLGLSMQAIMGTSFEY